MFMGNFVVLQSTVGRLTSSNMLFLSVCVSIFWKWLCRPLLCLVVQHNSETSLFNTSDLFLCGNSLYLLILSFAQIFCQKFFFKSQVIAKNKFDIGKCEDFVWVTKDELMEYFPEQAEFLNKMIISWWQWRWLFNQNYYQLVHWILKNECNSFWDQQKVLN
jgi:hypothetical protein